MYYWKKLCGKTVNSSWDKKQNEIEIENENENDDGLYSSIDSQLTASLKLS